MVPIFKRFYELNLDELYLILHGRQEVFTIGQGIIYQDLDFIDQKSIHVILKNPENGELISYARIIEPGVKYPETSLGRVLTMPTYRRKGFNRFLMKETLKKAVKLFGLPIRIEAQEYLTRFYDSLGFKAISDVFILEGIPHVEMVYFPQKEEV